MPAGGEAGQRAGAPAAVPGQAGGCLHSGACAQVFNNQGNSQETGGFDFLCIFILCIFLIFAYIVFNNLIKNDYHNIII